MSRTRETKNVDSEGVLILQLLRYDNVKGAVIKNTTRINCGSETLRLSISGDRQVCLFKRFNLKVTRNHFETLQIFGCDVSTYNPSLQGKSTVPT